MTASFNWENTFCEGKNYGCGKENGFSTSSTITSIQGLKEYLDLVHVKFCLVKPYFEQKNYPLVESRELLPSFESDVFEYNNLPGFSMVALNRPVNYFQEIFQFDIIHNLMEDREVTGGATCPLEQTVFSQNLQTMLNRLARIEQENFAKQFKSKDISDLELYPQLLRYLYLLDRAHVLSTDSFGNFTLAGVYASFPSDLDAEIKRFGLRLGKFRVGDNQLYERNRLFVYQYLMELYGFPISSERRTSAALFARRLHRLSEDFMVRVLSQSDRTITSIFSTKMARSYPFVEKIALVRVEKEQKEIITKLKKGGFFLDPKKNVVILRVKYRQHKYNPYNVRQDRALSVESQEVIHPLTGEVMGNLNIIKDTYNMFLRLNDIVRGEYRGNIVYKRHEVVENTDTDEKRLKFLYSWLSKHQRRIISYSDEFYSKISMVLDNYLLNTKNYDAFQEINELFQEVWSKYSYIQQARMVRTIEDLVQGRFKGKRLSRLESLKQVCTLMQELKFEIVRYFDELVVHILHLGERLLSDSYLRLTYVERKDTELTAYGLEIKRQYGKLVSLVDAFKDIRKTKQDRDPSHLRKTA